MPTRREANPEAVPKSVEPRFAEVTAHTDAVCKAHLNEEYAGLARELAAALGRKRPSPLLRGKPATWAAGIVYALGTVNFLFDRASEPYLRDRARITSHFGIPSPGHLWPILNRKILEIVLLLLRVCSIGSTKFDPDLGANSANLFLRGPLARATWLASSACRRAQRPTKAGRFGTSST
jgi:hypothetical protein